MAGIWDRYSVHASRVLVAVVYRVSVQQFYSKYFVEIPTILFPPVRFHNDLIDESTGIIKGESTRVLPNAPRYSHRVLYMHRPFGSRHLIYLTTNKLRWQMFTRGMWMGDTSRRTGSDKRNRRGPWPAEPSDAMLVGCAARVWQYVICYIPIRTWFLAEGMQAKKWKERGRRVLCGKWACWWWSTTYQWRKGRKGRGRSRTEQRAWR